jgi:hypothetical protein
MGVGAPKLARRVCLESVTLTGKTLSAVGSHPLAGNLATPAAESTHRTPWAGPAARGLRSSRPQTIVELGRVLAQWAALHCGARAA